MTYEEVVVQVSGNYLTDFLPANWNKMEEKELDEFLENHSWEPLEYWDTNDVWELIINAADTAWKMINRLHRDEIAVKWHIDDIKSRDNSLTDDECRNVLVSLKSDHDATIGINWDVIDETIYWEKRKNV
jgi:hypothetical protein